MSPDWFEPDWPAPERVRALVTTRHGGVSDGPWASMNLGAHVGDSPIAVARNRAILRAVVPAEPCWLNQVHGTDVWDAASAGAEGVVPRADAAVARKAGAVCAVMTADCLPVLFCDDDGSVVAAAHAGWRGLASGILDATVARMDVAPARIMAWMGPAIGPDAFEVGSEVRERFVAADKDAARAFLSAESAGKWYADLFELARQRLRAIGVERVYGGDVCTYSDPLRWFSYRRDGVTGRLASLVWLSD
ncbi:peptidoglycan editing factor PgeF [Aromatoleum toluclasticum]|uniref:peptidoglycan editing factor PgeF n=1 Tax=Aromatoleum toluclasticum TaxID=92003 RepID=UPI001D18C7C8|nr:peptidoglycan editing factor PgeF [Aromatoleum toluclasticum]MCC4116769.1 peptidoglycan editing factor PgeF [Aromatoleum toluclasticum]